MRIEWVTCVMALSLSFGLGACEVPQPARSPWRRMILENPQDARALILAFHIPREHHKYLGAGPDPVLTDYRLSLQIRRQKRVVPAEAWPVRPFVTALRDVVEHRPSSPFADDAALILARGRMLWYNDVNGALQELHKVVQDYPDGHWVAEDEKWLVFTHPLLQAVFRGEPLDPDTTPGLQGAIVNHIAVYSPNYTVDEAYMTIAMFYAEGYAKPPESQVEYYNKVIERHAEKNRFAEDLKFLETICYYPQGYQDWIVRHEDVALLKLMGYYQSKGDIPNALLYARRYIEKMNGHPFRCGTVYPAMIKMEESLGHSEAAATYRQKLAEAEQAWKKFEDIRRTREHQEKYWKRKDTR